MMVQRKKLTAEQSIQRAKLYCAYQERCHAEIKDKLFSFGLSRNDVEQIISQLIEEDYLNEERYASAYARGKFRMKQWGRVKIRYELKQKRISENCIKSAMREIDENEYLRVLEKLAEEKSEEVKGEESAMLRKKKVVDYLLQKGFERDLIFSCIKE